MIIQGKVRVDGRQITQLGVKINPEKNKIEYNGKEIIKKKKYTYILLNKPIGYITTVSDQFNRKTVLDLVHVKGVRLVPVGRLDMFTSGAIILTNDGDFIYKITHPKYEITKTYNVTIVGEITVEDIEKLKNGIDIGGVITSKAQVKILKIDKEKNVSRLQITIHEGKNRQIRRMCEALGKKVLSLHRSKIGDITVKDLEIGSWRYLKQVEINKLLKNNIAK